VTGAAAAAARALSVAVAVAAAIALPAPASAQTAAVAPDPAAKKIVGILEVRVDGVSPTVAERFETSIEEGLSSAEMWIATRKRLREMLAGTSWSEGCVFGPCLAEVKRQTGADMVVVAYFQGRGSSYRFVVSLVDTESGRVREQTAERCEVCTLSEALDAAALATIGLVHGAAPAGTRPPPRPRRVPPVAHRDDRRVVRRAALLLAGAGLLAGGVGVYFLRKDDDDIGYAALGAAGSLTAAGAVVFGLSFAFD
jgi:hypothetical protein